MLVEYCVYSFNIVQYIYSSLTKKEVVGVKRQPAVRIPVNPELIAQLNLLAKEQFELQVIIGVKNRAFEVNQQAEAAAHAANIGADEARMDAIDAQLWKLIEGNRSSLIPSGRESFVTGVATFRFDNYPSKREVLEPKELMAKARKFRVVRWIAKRVYRWDFVATKFFAFFDELETKLKKNAKLKEAFQAHIEDVPAWRKLSVTPNATYAVVLDNTRLTPPPITSRRDVDEKGNIIESTSEPTPES